MFIKVVIESELERFNDDGEAGCGTSFEGVVQGLESKAY